MKYYREVVGYYCIQELEFFAPKTEREGKGYKVANSRAVDVIGKGWHPEVFADSRSEATDIGAATNSSCEVGDGKAVAWCATFFENIPVGADIGSSKVITEGFAEVCYWWNTIDFCERVFHYFGTHLGLNFSYGEPMDG
mgnify:CR=1 FL=1